MDLLFRYGQSKTAIFWLAEDIFAQISRAKIFQNIRFAQEYAN